MSEKHNFSPLNFTISKVDYASDYGNKYSAPAVGKIA
jgi:hypothetical protein